MPSCEIVNADCLEWLRTSRHTFKCIFADPPDNIGTQYGTYRDKKDGYLAWLQDCLIAFTQSAEIVWLSFNTKYLADVGEMAKQLNEVVELKACVQTFTFGQHNQNDFGNNHRPLWRFSHPGAKFYPNNIRHKSWRQLHGDKRADPRGRIPGDVFDFPRVTGNSKQRRRWHPTQLHEGLVARCILFSTSENDWVFDPFGGSGTTKRVCQRINRNCVLTEIDNDYCTRMAQESDGVATDGRETPTLALEMQAVCDRSLSIRSGKLLGCQSR